MKDGQYKSAQIQHKRTSFMKKNFKSDQKWPETLNKHQGNPFIEKNGAVLATDLHIDPTFEGTFDLVVFEWLQVFHFLSQRMK